ncbi:acyl-CoA thioester hydrolase [Luteibacter rhizovicinus]|uniref:Acyl-CoA thioester hydrolase n=1 Tax=Luteibacter rhizovicinus TaxID=242606 RepID=A0A4R3YWF8_9GAMM|nr:thioesterase family protein [Luteibacter rhizovicinus]TCV97011.1 acyl-CoA thioester hydrolase [Luteibacter rhizovicinus]
MTTEASKTPSPTPLLIAPITVRWRDLDTYNHVNNSNYLTYLEEARLQWLLTIPGKWYTPESAPVMAASQLNYRLPIEWPAEIDVELFCERVGTSSMTIGHRMVAHDDATRIHCDGNVTVVWVNPKTGRPVPLPDTVREAITQPA